MIEIDKLRQQIEVLESEKSELLAAQDRDHTLAQEKFSFLEQQREEAKQELQESITKFQQTISYLKKIHQNESADLDKGHKELIAQLEQRFQIELNHQVTSYRKEILDAESRIRQQEHEIKVFYNQSSLDSRTRSQLSEKKLCEVQESEKRLILDIQSISSSKEQALQVCRAEFERERKLLLERLQEKEQKLIEIEKKQTALIFDHEKEKVLWNLEKEHLHNQFK